jgi:hypothetical protein
LTIISPQLLNSITEWRISDHESVSDHSIIQYTIKSSITNRHEVKPPHKRFRTNKESLEKFQENILQALKKKFNLDHNTTRDEDLDNSLTTLLKEGANIDKLVEDSNEEITMTCHNNFQTQRAPRSAPSHRSVPWWSAELTALRKRTNAARKLYQRTKNNEELRDKRKTLYFESKTTYAATIKREKIKSWKEHCNVSTATNPWGGIYKLAEGKNSSITQISTLLTPDGSLTADIKETLTLMIDSFARKDDNEEDTEHHK